jgi:PPOX class probable F420-dependent enzyme
MGIALPDKIKQLIDGRNFAHLATIMPDGSPHSAPVWIGREGDRLIICTDEESVKGKNTRRDPRVAISIVDMKDPYSEATMRGRVVERRIDKDFSLLDTISKKYTGEPYPDHSGPAVALFIEVEKAHYSKEPFEYETAA